MAILRQTDEQLRQYASQLEYVPETFRREAEAWLPSDETEDFLHGLLCGLYIGYKAAEEERASLGPAVAVLAKQILELNAD
jgi:hypothetical protein